VLWFRDSCLRPWVSLLLTAICVVVRTGVLFVLKGSDVKYSRITVLQLAGMYSDLVFLWLAMSELSDSISRVRCLTNLSIYGGRTNRLAPDLEAVSTSSAAQFSYAAATDTCTVSSGLSAMHTLQFLLVKSFH
jgi:hypothetical protein